MNTTSRMATPANLIRAAVTAGLAVLAVCAAVPAHAPGAATRTSVTASGFGWDGPAPAAASSDTVSSTPDTGFGWE